MANPDSGSYAWRIALEITGNQDFRVSSSPGVAHSIIKSDSTCIVKTSGADCQVAEGTGVLALEEAWATSQRTRPHAVERLALRAGCWI